MLWVLGFMSFGYATREFEVTRDVLIPRGAVIGYHPDEDRRRHTVTDEGIVVVTVDEQPYVDPVDEQALRLEAAADRRG